MIFVCFALLFLFYQAVGSVMSISGDGLALDGLLRSALPSTSVVALFYILIATLLMTYARILRRGEERRISFVAGFALVVLLIFVTPARSSDVFSYLAHGHNAAGNLREAHVRPIRAVESSYVDSLARVNGLPAHAATPYGPLWTYTELFAFRISNGDVFAGMIILKAVGAMAFLGTVMIAAELAGVSAALAILYNPLLLGELVAEGHNDALLIFFVVLALFLVVRGYVFWAVVAFGLSVLTKFTPAIFAGPVIAFLIARRKPWCKMAVVGLIATAFATVILYFPIWAGTETFSGLWEGSSGLPAIMRVGFSGFFKKAPQALRVIKGAMYVVFLTYFFWQSRTVRQHVSLYRAGALILLGYLLFFPHYVWPWYVALPVVLFFLAGSDDDRGFAFYMSAVATLNAPVWSFIKTERVDVETGHWLHHFSVPGLLIAGFYFCHRCPWRFRFGLKNQVRR